MFKFYRWLCMLFLLVVCSLSVGASLNCSFSPHVLSLPDRQIRWSCNLNTTRDVSCVSFMKDSSGLVQVNPTGELSSSFSPLDFFDRDVPAEYFVARSGLLNVYFKYSGLRSDINYSLGVLCANGEVFERNVTVDFLEPRVVADRSVWLVKVLPFIIFFVVLVFLLVYLLKFGKRLYD